MQIKFTVLGEPQGKARARTVKLKNGDSHSYTPQKTVLYENLIATEYRRQTGSVRFPDDSMLDLRIIAYYTIPASATKTRKQLMESRELRPTKKPDADNIVKVVSDALNNMAYRDDAQIVDCQVRKFYSTAPRIEVSVSIAK